MRGALSSADFFSQFNGTIKAFTDPSGAVVANTTVITPRKATSLTSFAENRTGFPEMSNFEQRSHHRRT